MLQPPVACKQHPDEAHIFMVMVDISADTLQSSGAYMHDVHMPDDHMNDAKQPFTC